MKENEFHLLVFLLIEKVCHHVIIICLYQYQVYIVAGGQVPCVYCTNRGMWIRLSEHCII